MRQDIILKSERKVKNYDLTFSADTINCVCHSIRSIFKVLGMYNFDTLMEKLRRKKSRVSEIDVLVQKQLYNEWNLPVIEFSNLKS